MQDRGVRIGHWAEEFLDNHYPDPDFLPKGNYQVEIFLTRDFPKEEPKFIKKIESMLGSPKNWAPYVQLAPRICEVLTVSDFRELDLWRVVIPQASFVKGEKSLHALGASCFRFPDNQEVWMSADTLSPNRQASDHCSFAFITPL